MDHLATLIRSNRWQSDYEVWEQILEQGTAALASDDPEIRRQAIMLADEWLTLQRAVRERHTDFDSSNHVAGEIYFRTGLLDRLVKECHGLTFQQALGKVGKGNSWGCSDLGAMNREHYHAKSPRDARRVQQEARELKHRGPAKRRKAPTIFQHTKEAGGYRPDEWTNVSASADPAGCWTRERDCVLLNFETKDGVIAVVHAMYRVVFSWTRLSPRRMQRRGSQLECAVMRLLVSNRGRHFGPPSTPLQNQIRFIAGSLEINEREVKSVLTRVLRMATNNEDAKFSDLKTLNEDAIPRPTEPEMVATFRFTEAECGVILWRRRKYNDTAAQIGRYLGRLEYVEIIERIINNNEASKEAA